MPASPPSGSGCRPSTGTPTSSTSPFSASPAPLTWSVPIAIGSDAWHDSPERVHYDKHRNNELESHGWSVLRFTQERIEREPEKAVSLLYDTINRNGGYQVLNEPDEFRYVQRGSQLRLDF
ncbi:MAG: DUF559 domain-containing protein [Saprospiraceae bacterium]|nr:DUF559 domain-containing protein [Saprospiraceae bacterium]